MPSVSQIFGYPLETICPKGTAGSVPPPGSAPKPLCRVESCYSPWTEQIVAGYCELARRGLIELEFVRKGSLSQGGDRPRVGLQALIEGRRVAYDVFDDGRAGMIDPALPNAGLGKFDFYFKRSFAPRLHANLASRCVVLPLGLNYLVSPSRVRLRDKLLLLNGRRVAKRLSGRDHKIDYFERPPQDDQSPRALFMTRAWNPADTADERVRPDIVALNESRAQLIRVARTAFGDRFYGGLLVDDFARRHYPDCLLSTAAAGSKTNFLAQVRRSSICIASTGLWGSIGWKMAEYIAASRAIVSEPLHYELPGDFAAGRNYLEFSTADGLCEAVERLLTSAALRREMMHANWAYYHGWVRPDAFVQRTIRTVVEGALDSRKAAA
jgi:hypothetical protein